MLLLKEEFRDMRKNIDDMLSTNSNRGFKSSNKTYRRIFNRRAKEAKAVDKFGDDYFYSDPNDVTESISITLPRSLIMEINDYCRKKGITRSRMIKKIIEYSLNLKKVD